MAETNHSVKENLLKIKNSIEFLGETFTLAHKEVLVDEDWQIDLMLEKHQLSCIIHLLGEDNFDKARKLAHKEADKKYPKKDEKSKNVEYYGKLLSDLITSIGDIIPKDLRSDKLAWRSR